jgi:hypothetical protein
VEEIHRVVSRPLGFIRYFSSLNPIILIEGFMLTYDISYTHTEKEFDQMRHLLVDS